jgi:hypothetical protein
VVRLLVGVVVAQPEVEAVAAGTVVRLWTLFLL